MGVVLLAQAAVAMVIQDAVAQLILPQECPYVTISPIEYWEYACELRPALAAGADGCQVLGVRVSASIAHDDSSHALLVDQSLHLGFEVRAKQLHLDTVVLLDLVPESDHFGEFIVLDKVDILEPAKCVFFLSV